MTAPPVSQPAGLRPLAENLWIKSYPPSVLLQGAHFPLWISALFVGGGADAAI